MNMVPIRLAEAVAPAPGAAVTRFLIVALIALTPVLFALSTWDPTESGGQVRLAMRIHSVPVLAVEALIVLGAMAGGFEPMRAARTSPPWMQAALILLLAIGFATALFVAPLPGVAVVRTCMWVLHLAFGLAAYHLLVRHRSSVAKALWPSVAAGMCGYALVVVLYVLAIEDPARFDWAHFGLAATNIRHMGTFSAVGAAAALGLAADARGGRYALWVAAASLTLALSFWSGTRGSLVAVFCAFGLGLAVLPCLRSIRAISALIVSVVSGGLLSLAHTVADPAFGLLRVMVYTTSGTPDALSNGRMVLWEGTMRTFWQRPVFGFGESQFKIVVPEALGYYNHPHNIVLQIMLQWGFVGALCFFALGAAILWQALRAVARDGSNLAPPLLVGSSLLVYALYDGALYYAYPIMMTALAGAAILVSRGNPASQVARTRVS